MQTIEQQAERVKVKRDGPRGWHWIAATHYDPSKHVLFDSAPAKIEPLPETAPAVVPVKRGRGRPRKVNTDHRMEATNGYR